MHCKKGHAGSATHPEIRPGVGSGVKVSVTLTIMRSAATALCMFAILGALLNWPSDLRREHPSTSSVASSPQSLSNSMNKSSCSLAILSEFTLPLSYSHSGLDNIEDTIITLPIECEL